MSLGDWIRRALGMQRDAVQERSLTTQAPSGSDSESTGADSRRAAAWNERAKAWHDAMEAGLLDLPRNRRDRDAWDNYWTNHLKCGLMEQGFADSMSSDPTLPSLLKLR